MGPSPVAVRPISAEERAVLERALRFAATGDAAGFPIEKLDSLHVVGKCPCGCASIDFRHLNEGEIAEVVADAIGETRDGEQVEVLVFALDGDVVALEIVGYADTPARLPIASTVRGWDGQGSQVAE